MRRLIILCLGLVLLCGFTLSCSRDEAEPRMEGNWTGTYDGADDQGTWKATISLDKVFKGETKSTKSSLVQEVNGTVDENGNVHAETSMGVVFTGKIENNRTVSGTWSFGTSSGTWSGNRN